MVQYLVGIDVGTTGTKAMLLSEHGEIVSWAYRGYPIKTPQMGCSEQNPEDWWNAVVETVHEVCRCLCYSETVRAISLSVQGGTVVPVDDHYKALYPAIVWNDSRCEEQHQAFIDEVGDPQTLYQLSGWGLGKALPLLEIRWLRDKKPELFDQTAYFLTVPDYLSWRLTGRRAVDLSNLGINELGDIRNKCYNEKLLHFAGIHREQLSEIVHSGDVIGMLTEEASKELGLNRETMVVAGAHDQYAVAVGGGALKNGDVLIGSGTCWVMTAISDKPNFESGLAQSVSAVPGLWGSIWSLPSGGICLEWIRQKIMAGDNGRIPDFNEINEAVSTRKAAENGLFFYPFSGIGKDHKRLERGSFVGLDLSHDRFNLCRAIMEGIAFQMRWMSESFICKPSKDGIVLSGGASKSAVWSQILADIFGLPVKIPQYADLACVGAAVLAGTGCGLFTSIQDGFEHVHMDVQQIMPNHDKHQMYEAIFRQYQNLL